MLVTLITISPNMHGLSHVHTWMMMVLIGISWNSMIIMMHKCHASLLDDDNVWDLKLIAIDQ